MVKGYELFGTKTIRSREYGLLLGGVAAIFFGFERLIGKGMGVFRKAYLGVFEEGKKVGDEI